MPIHFKGHKIEPGDVRYKNNSKNMVFNVVYKLLITFPKIGNTYYRAPFSIDIGALVSNLKDGYLIDYGDGSPEFIDVAGRFKDIYHEYINTNNNDTQEFIIRIVAAGIEPNLVELIQDGVLKHSGSDLPYKIHIRRGV